MKMWRLELWFNYLGVPIGAFAVLVGVAGLAVVGVNTGSLTALFVGLLVLASVTRDIRRLRGRKPSD